MNNETEPIAWVRVVVVGLALALAVAYRIYAPRLGLTPNVELVTVTAFLAASLLRSRWAALVPLAAVAVSDLVLGNTFLLAFTWGAWALIGLGALLTRRAAAKSAVLRLGAALGFGVGGTALFFVVTNFGVWATTGWYPRTLDGLSTAFAMGVPFARPQLLANLIALPIAVVVVMAVERLVPAVRLEVAPGVARGSVAALDVVKAPLDLQ